MIFWFLLCLSLFVSFRSLFHALESIVRDVLCSSMKWLYLPRCNLRFPHIMFFMLPGETPDFSAYLSYLFFYFFFPHSVYVQIDTCWSHSHRLSFFCPLYYSACGSSLERSLVWISPIGSGTYPVGSDGCSRTGSHPSGCRIHNGQPYFPQFCPNPVTRRHQSPEVDHS